MDRASVSRRNKWELLCDGVTPASQNHAAAAFSRSRSTFACGNVCYLQGLVPMGIAVEINGKSQCSTWMRICLHTATCKPSLKITAHVVFQFLRLLLHRFSHLFLLLTDGLDRSSPHSKAMSSLTCSNQRSWSPLSSQ